MFCVVAINTSKAHQKLSKHTQSGTNLISRHNLPPMIGVGLMYKSAKTSLGFLVYLELEFYCLCSLQKSISKLILQAKNSVRQN